MYYNKKILYSACVNKYQVNFIDSVYPIENRNQLCVQYELSIWWAPILFNNIDIIEKHKTNALDTNRFRKKNQQTMPHTMSCTVRWPGRIPVREQHTRWPERLPFGSLHRSGQRRSSIRFTGPFSRTARTRPHHHQARTLTVAVGLRQSRHNKSTIAGRIKWVIRCDTHLDII